MRHVASPIWRHAGRQFCVVVRGRFVAGVAVAVACALLGAAWSVAAQAASHRHGSHQRVHARAAAALPGFRHGGGLLPGAEPSPLRVTTTYPSELTGVSCPPKGSCIAVGYYLNSSGYNQTLIEKGNSRRWSVLSSPNTSTSHDDELYGVSCPSSKFCVAVGDYYVVSSDTYKMLIESWDGHRWSIMTSVDPSTTYNELYGVSCPSSSSCTAVGWYEDTDLVDRTLIESWNPTDGWTQETGVDPSTADNELYGVSCVSSDSCKAVGEYDNNRYALIESWDGTSWTQQTAAQPGDTGNFLRGVSCTGSDFCTAVGYYTPSGMHTPTLIESWNGTSWTQKTGADYVGYDNHLYGVSCPTSAYCAAAGDFINAASRYQTLIESWSSGGSGNWTRPDSPNVNPPTTGFYDNHLFGVSCTSSTSCFAVGRYTATTRHTLIEYWDGSNWTIMPSPDAFTITR